MLSMIKTIITNVLIALYQPFWFSILITVLFMFLYLYAKEHGWKVVFQKWWNIFKTSGTFRKLFFLCFYTSLILFRTLLNRNIWANPLSNVMGNWGLYNEYGQLTTEAIENFLLFMPFTVLLLWTFPEMILGESTRVWKILWKSAKITFLCSLTIEFAQLLFYLGTFQLSDLCYNTLGGMVGGFFYWVGKKIHRTR